MICKPKIEGGGAGGGHCFSARSQAQGWGIGFFRRKNAVGKHCREASDTWSWTPGPMGYSYIGVEIIVIGRRSRPTHIGHPLPTLTPVGIVFCTRSSQGERENCLSRKGEEGARRPQIL